MTQAEVHARTDADQVDHNVFYYLDFIPTGEDIVFLEEVVDSYHIGQPYPDVTGGHHITEKVYYCVKTKPQTT